MNWIRGLTNLRNILAELYPTILVSRQVVEQAGLPTGLIEFNPASTSNWHGILKQAHLHKKVTVIVSISVEEFPAWYDELKQAEQEYLSYEEATTDSVSGAPGGESAREENYSKTEVSISRDVLIELRDILANRFNTNELKKLCFDLDFDYEDLPGQGKSSKAQELVDYCKRRSRIPELIKVGQRQRPDIGWPSIP